MTRRQEQIIKDEKKQQRKKRKNGKFNQIRKKVVKKSVKSEEDAVESKPQLPQQDPNAGKDNDNTDVSVDPQQQPPAKKKRRLVERLVHPNVSRNRRSNACYGFATPESSTKNEVHNIVQQIMDEMLNRVEKAAIVLDEAEKMNLDVTSAKEEVVKRRLSVESLEPSKEETDPIKEYKSEKPLEEVTKEIPKVEPLEEMNVTEQVEDNTKNAPEVSKANEVVASQIQPKKPAKKKKPSITDIINRLKSKDVEQNVQPSEQKEIISETLVEPIVKKVEVVKSPRKRRRNTLPAPVNGIITEEAKEQSNEKESKFNELTENVQSPKSKPPKRRRNTTIVVDSKIDTTEVQVEKESSPSKVAAKRSPRKKNKIVEIEPAVIANDNVDAKPDAPSNEESKDVIKEVLEENIPTTTPKKRLRTPVKKKDDFALEYSNVEVEKAKSEPEIPEVKSRRTPRKSIDVKIETSDNHTNEDLLSKTSQSSAKSKRARVKKKAKSKNNTGLGKEKENGKTEPDLDQVPPEILPIVQEQIAKSDAKRTTPRKAKPPTEDLPIQNTNQETSIENDAVTDDDAQIKEVLEEILNRRASIESNTSLSVSDQNDPPEQIVDIVKPELEQPLPIVNTETSTTFEEASNEIFVQPSDIIEDEIAENGVDAQPSEVKKRRSSFAASFYSSQPMRERSLRRSNGRINYVEDLDEVIKIEDDLNMSIRRKKRPNNSNEGCESVKKRSKSTSSSSSDVAEKSVKSTDKKKSNRKSKNNFVNGGSNVTLSKVSQQESKEDAFDNLFNGVTNDIIPKKENITLEESKGIEDRPRRNVNSSFSYLEEFADEDDNSLLGFDNEAIENSVEKKKSKKRSKEPSEPVTKKHKKKKKKKASKKGRIETPTEDEEDESVLEKVHKIKKAKLTEKVQDENRQNDNNTTTDSLTNGQDMDRLELSKNESAPQDMPIRRRSVNNEDVSSTDDERPRRHLNNNLMLDASVSARVIFPLEVKACAIQRIKDGATKVQVARDLGAPLSTVASWWHRRSSIVPDATPEDTNSDSASVSSAEHELTEKNACMLIANSTSH